MAGNISPIWALFGLCAHTAACDPKLHAHDVYVPHAIAPDTFHEARAAVLHMPGDAAVGLVFAAGFDFAAQPVTMHVAARTPGAGFPAAPSWRSLDVNHNTAVAVGDLDGDGRDDVVLGAIAGERAAITTGNIRVYRGCSDDRGPACVCDNSLCTRPQVLASGFPVTGLALADLDRDGDLDLAAAVPWEPTSALDWTPGPTPADDPKGARKWPSPLRPLDGAARIFTNVGDGALVLHTGQFATGAVDVVADDIDDDGWIDLAWTGQATTIDFGAAPDAARRASWRASQGHVFSYDIAVGHLADRTPLLAVSHTCYMPTPRCTPDDSEFRVYRPLDSVEPVQTIPARACEDCSDEYAAAVTIADVVGGDGVPDLLVGLWTSGHGTRAGNAVQVFPGGPGERPFHTGPDARQLLPLTDDHPASVGAIVVADLLPPEACPGASPPAHAAPEIVVVSTDVSPEAGATHILRNSQELCIKPVT